MATGSGTGTPVTGIGFCTLVDLEQFLQVDIDDADKVASANRAIVEATVAIQNYCRQQIELAEDEEITLDSAGGTRVFLPELPVIDVSVVVEDDETLDVDDDYKLGQHGILHRVGAYWTSGIQIVQITYSHGYATIPDDVVSICARAAARAYQAGLRAAEVEGVPGVASKSLGDYAVAFGAEAGGSQEGVLGASAAPILLRSEKRILDRYRV